jgi:uncharacterized protein (TIGR02680 family)
VTGVADRFRLVRAGILNLYEYADQVFELAGGRLLLRGHNTSGKTKALELLLPFCLDGEITPYKLDPFAKSAKDMRWNLVGCIEGDQRTGYVWLEFERLSAEGVQRVTGLIGMKANANVPGVRRWYAVVRDRRIGVDLQLRRSEVPLSRAELAAELGDECPLLDKPSHYRSALNEAVFGFPSDEAYGTMITLMLELRRPHLSKALNPHQVTELLTQSLPEVDHDLIRRLGDGLEQLEEMRRALERLRVAHGRLERFVADSYSAYARAVLRERGDDLRQAETRFANAARRHREAVASAEQGQRDVERIAGELDAARAAAERAEGALTALLQSPEWQSVEAVEQLARRAEAQERSAREARKRADEAAGEAAWAEAQEARSAGDLAEARHELELARGHLRTAATTSGFGSRHAVLDEQLATADPEMLRGLAGAEASAWRDTLVAHEGLLREVERCERLQEQAKGAEESAELRLRGARKSLGDARARCEAEQEALAEAVTRWASELRELPVADVDAVLAVALEAGRPEAGDPCALWRDGASMRLGELTQARASTATHLGSLSARASELRQGISEVDADVDRGPDRWSTRPADRAGRPGMPLWQAVEFAPELDSRQRAALEAALDGAGLLDAWLTADGRLLDPRTLDAVLVPATGVSVPDGARSLASALGPSARAPAGTRSVLATIALVDDAPAVGRVAVDLRGGYALGPLRGRYTKAEAEHIGAAARAAARARRRAALLAELEQVEQKRAETEAVARELAARTQRLADEQSALPSTDRLASANRELLVAEQLVDQQTADHAEAAGATRRAGHEVEHSRGLAGEHAERCGLPARLDLRELRTRAEAAGRYEDGLQYAVGALRRARSCEQRVLEDSERVAEQQARARELNEAAEREASEARRLTAEHAEREVALGSGAAALRERRGTVEIELSEARAATERLHIEDRKAAGSLATATAAAATAGEREESARADREAALAAFARLERADVFRLALAVDAPEDHRAAADWTLTRALEVLRAIPPARLASDPSDRLAAALTRACSELDRDLAQQGDMSVYTTLDADSVMAVRVRDGAAERSLPELTAVLASQIAERDRTLTAEQRRVFGQALLEEIATHLRARIHDVRTRVDEMNGILRHSATAAGKVVQLGWRSRSDNEAAAAIPLIGKPASGLSELERETLVSFFRGRIELAQSAEIETDDGETAIRTLRDAFDYRQWFRFELWEGVGRERVALTAARHAVGSGGEQAVLVHLPLFAAAAALYEGAPGAPRLVMLDEALSGIDDDTRARVMGALVDLDLDFVMTSHELWGTYHTVPSLAIYQLYREQGLFGVHCERFVWDGSLLREEEQGELFRA